MDRLNTIALLSISGTNQKLQMNTNILSCYIANSFNSAEAQLADSIFAALTANLQSAIEITARCKKSLFLVKSNFPAYENALKQHGPKRRRAMIDKQRGLACNYHALFIAFKYYCKSLITNIEALAKLMPVLIEDSSSWSGNSTVNTSRQCNTVLCARVIKAIPQMLTELNNQFHIPDARLTALASGDLTMLRTALFCHQEASYYAAPLDLIYLPCVGAAFAPESNHLDEQIYALSVVVQKAQAVYQAFMEERSKAFNTEALHVEMTGVQNKQQLVRLMEEGNDTVRRYGIAKHACEMARYALCDALNQTEKALETADKSHNMLRGTGICQTASQVLFNNLVAARCRLIAADVVLKATRVKDEDSENRVQTHPLRTEAYRLLKENFEAIPARFVTPFLPFLK